MHVTERRYLVSTDTQLGTAELQGRLWSVNAASWAELHEQYMQPAYVAALDALGVTHGTRLLDVGCGAGLALQLAADRGADVSGLDAAPGLLNYARRRVPSAKIVEGELQSLPFPDGAFDAVTGFNSFQYAADPIEALRDAKRVTAPGGRILALVWSPAELCELAPHLQSLGALMPPPPPGTAGTVRTVRPRRARGFLRGGRARGRPRHRRAVHVRLPDTATATAALSSAGPVVRIAEHAGWDAVRDDIGAFLAGKVRADGTYAISNPFRYALSTPVG